MIGQASASAIRLCPSSQQIGADPSYSRLRNVRLVKKTLEGGREALAPRDEMRKQDQTPQDLPAEELEQVVLDFIARDGPGPGDLPADTFFALWERFEAERRAQVIELEQDIIGGEIVLSVAPTSPVPVSVKGNEIRLADGRRIVLRLRRPSSTDSTTLSSLVRA